ncbi:MAG: 3'-5' exonuclease [Saprospirales bacterium]|nr:MAG: 3'-5' exonuclease [Saprospirales bacterium]
MKLQLTNDLCFFDIEATGLHVIRDRIIQIGILKYSADTSEPSELNLMVNPGIPIPQDSTRIHGIRDEDVADKPVFSKLAQQVFDFIGDADLAGYNCLSYDVPMLLEEMHRAGIDMDMDNRRVIDVQRIFYKMEPRNLAAAYRYYCGKNMTEAHEAMADVRATAEVLAGQLEMYSGVDLKLDDGEVIPEPVRNDVQALHEFTNDSTLIDATRRLKYNHNGEVIFNFGKYIGKPVAPLLAADKQYLNWILQKDFSFQVKSIVQKLVKEYEAQQKK